MADTVKAYSELGMNFGYYDGDTHLYKLQNPKSDLTAAQIKAAAQIVINNNAFVGDKAGAAVVSLLEAKATSVTKTQLDLASV